MIGMKFSDELYQKIIDGDIIWISIEGWYYKELIS
jgi:hypothetical protein